jgi:hypothetical protein
MCTLYVHVRGIGKHRGYQVITVRFATKSVRLNYQTTDITIVSKVDLRCKGGEGTVVVEN